MFEVNKSILKNIYKEKPIDSKKYDYGLVLVIGGSQFYSGSPALASVAAFRTGVDMVRIIAPKRAADIIASLSPNLAAFPLEGDWLEKKHLATLISMTEGAKDVSHGKTAVVIGGGTGRTAETQEVILEYLSQVSVPVVIDADAIHAIGKNCKLFSGKNFLITPNVHEFFILTGKEVFGLTEDQKIKMVEEEARCLGSTILLKGVADIISDGKETAVVRAGSPYMSKGGCGDTLAGVCGALLARGISPFEAAQAGSFINSKAGELASKKLKEGMLATDLIKAIPEILHM